MIKAVLFDLDGTLYDRDALAHELFTEQYASFEAELVGISQERFINDVLEMDDHGYGIKDEGYRRIVGKWQLPPALAGRLAAHFFSIYDRHCTLSEDTATTLETLRANGKQLGVITNGNTERQLNKLSALGLADAFDVVLISEAEGVRKPDAEIFNRALTRCGVAAAEAVYVGDHPEADVEGARKAGLLPIWKHVPYWTLTTKNVATVHNLSEILPICLGPDQWPAIPQRH